MCVHAVCVYVSVLLTVCVSGTTSPATTRNRESNRRYLWHRRNLENILIWRFCFVQELWREKANKLSMCYRDIIIMAPMERHFARNFEDRAFSESLMAGYKLPGSELLVFQPYSLYKAFAFVVFGILSVTCLLALSQSLAHAQQLHARPNNS